MSAKKKKKQAETEMKVKITWKEVKQQKVLLFWSAVIVIYGIIFYYLPLGGWLMAFQNYKPVKGLLHSEFVGLDKFKRLFSDSTFIRVIRNTLAMGLINLVVTFVMAILFAILLNEIRQRRTKKVIQTVSYLPHFLSWIIVTGILHDALSGTGIVNELLKNSHLTEHSVDFFAHTSYFWPIVAFANVWKETGWNAIIYLSAITSIDPSLYEAASIDGAGRLAKIMHVTLPGIKPTIIILLLMNVGNILNAGFEIQYLLGNGLVKSVSETIDIYVLKWGISQGDYAIGTAAGIFKSVVSILLYVNGGLIPTFILFKNLGLTNSFWVYIVPGMISAFNMLVIRTYMNGLPDSLVESAQLDGAGYTTIFIKIISPLCKPVYATVALFVAVGQWNSWFDAMLYNRMSGEYTTLQYELMKLLSSVTQTGATAESMKNAVGAVTPASVRAAATIITMLPIICIYPFLQKYFVTGLTLGGVKE